VEFEYNLTKLVIVYIFNSFQLTRKRCSKNCYKSWSVYEVVEFKKTSVL